MPPGIDGQHLVEGVEVRRRPAVDGLDGVALLQRALRRRVLGQALDDDLHRIAEAARAPTDLGGLLGGQERLAVGLPGLLLGAVRRVDRLLGDDADLVVEPAAHRLDQAEPAAADARRWSG